MKKIFSAMCAIALMVSMTVIASCSSKPDDAAAGKIIEKAQTEDLTESDYGTLLDYIDGAMDDVLPLFEKIQKASEDGDFDKVMSFTEEAQKLEAKYSNLQDALDLIEDVSDEAIGSANVEKGKKILEKMQKAGIPIDAF